jgi:hypothetical protein
MRTGTRNENLRQSLCNLWRVSTVLRDRLRVELPGAVSRDIDVFDRAVLVKRLTRVEAIVIAFALRPARRPIDWRGSQRRPTRSGVRMSTYARVDGVPPAEILPTLARTSTTLPTTTGANTQPTRKAELLLLAWLSEQHQDDGDDRHRADGDADGWGKIALMMFPIAYFLEMIQ